MKVIDLLNKIANGEEVPEKIQVYSDIFVLDEGNKLYEHENTRTNLLSIYNGNILNYEVRIKEDKKIEKIKILNCDNYVKKENYETILTMQEIALDIQTLRHKLDKIIDYINGSDKE